MPEPMVDLLGIDCGSVEAPAGCGKTELIVAALAKHDGEKPILVLTHTNAGVAALRHRLSKRGIVQQRYRLFTLDGWVLRLLKTFPLRAAIPLHYLEVNSGADYPVLRNATVSLLSDGHLTDVILASYGRLIVDEYQDCNRDQHAIVGRLAAILPTVVLGDPMQEIFNWENAHPHWDLDVRARFPLAAVLQTPWRWKNAGTENLGTWLLAVRAALKAGNQIDLRNAPAEVNWVHLDGSDDEAKRRAACMVRSTRKGGEVLIMAGGREKEVQRSFAKSTPGAVTVEAVDLTDVTNFASQMDLETPGCLGRALDFAFNVMTGVQRQEIINRVRIIRAGTNRTAAENWEVASMRFDDTGAASDLVALFRALETMPGARTFRPDILGACIKALQGTGGGVDFLEAAKRVREQQRVLGRRLPVKAVGSPLLLKGLEGDVAIILDPNAFDRIAEKNRKNLYVAMTRGSRQLVVCSASPLIG